MAQMPGMERRGGPSGLLSLCLVACVLSFATPVARADEVKDEVREDGHDVSRSVKKAGNRIDEAACTGTKAECAAKKSKHRVQETGDKVSDKVDEGTEKVKEKVQ